MALHINLYHEIQTLDLQRKRDPLRLGLVAILLVAAAFIAYYFLRLQDSARTEKQYTLLKNEWTSLSPLQTKAAERQKELMVAANLKETLLRKIEDRCLWGPILDIIAQSVPPDIHLKSFEATKPFQSEKSRTVAFTIAGVAAGVEPRRTAEDFRVSLGGKLSTMFKNVSSLPKDGFRSLEDLEEKVTLRGQVAATAAFVVSYDASLDAAPAATASPTPRASRARR